jgi:hypothetical protein
LEDLNFSKIRDFLNKDLKDPHKTFPEFHADRFLMELLTLEKEKAEIGQSALLLTNR